MYLSGVNKAVLVPLRVFGPKRLTAGAFAAPFRVLSREKKLTDKRCVVSVLVSLRGEQNFKPCPQNRILGPLRGSFQNVRRAPPSFL